MMVAFLLTVEGCGGGEATAPVQSVSPDMIRMAKQIDRAFVHETGVSLVLTQTPAIEPRLAAAVFLKPPDQLKKRFGEFVIHVSATPIEAGGFGVQQDKDGIWWSKAVDERSADPPLWVAGRVFGNVELHWFTAHRRIDSRWSELVRIVEAGLG
jgi:hypothetical protein